MPRLVVEAAPGEQRLDVMLAEALDDLSRAQVQRLIEAGRVTVDGLVPRKTGLKVYGGEHVVVDLPKAAPARIQAEAIPLDVIYEDKNVIVINKPAGMVVHPAAGHHVGTLVHAVLGHAPDIEGVGGEKRPGLVHRLDKDTSGLIVLAKNDRAFRYVQAQFKARTVRKMYLALVYGQLPSPTGRIEAYIGRDPRNRQKMAVTIPEKGREAITEYRVRETFSRYSLVEVEPKTGRTHQIRVHLTALGCPIVGDALYAGAQARQPLPGFPKGLTRQFLHAAELTLQLPGKVEHTFRCPLPDDLRNLLVDLG